MRHFDSNYWIIHSMGILWLPRRQVIAVDICRCCNIGWRHCGYFLTFRQVWLASLSPHSSYCFYYFWCRNRIALYTFLLLFQRPCLDIVCTTPCIWLMLHPWCISIWLSNSRKVLPREMRLILPISSDFSLLRGACCLYSLS